MNHRADVNGCVASSIFKSRTPIPTVDLPEDDLSQSFSPLKKKGPLPGFFAVNQFSVFLPSFLSCFVKGCFTRTFVFLFPFFFTIIFNLSQIDTFYKSRKFASGEHVPKLLSMREVTLGAAWPIKP